MKVVFMGTPDFSVGTLKAIVEADMKLQQLSHSLINRKEEAVR